MTPVLVDSNVILDVLTNDPDWGEWSESALETAADRSRIVINVIIYSEISVRFSSIEEADIALHPVIERESIPYEAAFLAGKAFASYRKRGGPRPSMLPDFLIGAHAAVARYALLTRDPQRIASYFPTVKLISP